jgi:hypothetical protein
MGVTMKEEKKPDVITIIPAEVGYLFLCPYFDGEGTYVDEHPIIAWRIVDSYAGVEAQPVTPDWGVNDGIHVQSHYVQYPDGRVISAGDREWISREAWLKDMEEKAAKETAIKKAEVA